MDKFSIHYPMYRLGAEKGRVLRAAMRQVNPTLVLELGTFLGGWVGWWMQARTHTCVCVCVRVCVCGGGGSSVCMHELLKFNCACMHAC